ncbi:MAG: hypothetical protein KA316_14490 [Rhodoferax sp.]|nr:hypothetical protein [Rhodoferax sp.]
MAPIPASVLRQTGLRQGVNVGIRKPGRITPLEKSTVISFDDVASDTMIDTHYAGQGVTLAAVLAGTGTRGHVYARNSWNIDTAPNGVTLIDPSIATSFFDDATGCVEVLFEFPHSWVSIDAMPLASPDDLRPITAKPYLDAYDAAGVRLGRVSYAPNHGDALWGSWQRLRLDAAGATIRSVRIGSLRDNGCPVYGLFDQLMFSNDLTG